MLDITAIILTYNEELHIHRCLENVNQFAKRVYVIDCFSKDKTVEIAESMGATVVQHQWPGNQAEQFNWALENINIDTEWILRLDADEYCSENLIAEMREHLPKLSTEYYAVVLPLGRVFMGRELKHGIANGIKMIRLFRNGKAKYEKHFYDSITFIKAIDITKYSNLLEELNIEKYKVNISTKINKIILIINLVLKLK